MAVRGIFASHMGITGERQQDLSSRVLMTQYGGMAPMLALSSGMPKDKANTTSWAWIEDDQITGNYNVGTGGNSTVTTLTLDSVGILMANTVVMNQSNTEYMLVTAVNATTGAVTVVRGFVGTTAATVNTNDKLQVIGTAYGEGSDRPSAVSQQGEERTNYMQIFKNGWALTGTANAIGYVTGNKLAANKSLCFGYHAEEIERGFLWGRKGRTTDAAGKELRLSHGIVPQIEDYGGLVEAANTGSVAGNLSLNDLSDFLKTIFDKQIKGMPNERLGYLGSSALQVINNCVKLDGSYQIESRESEWGIRVTTIVGINGELKLITHPMMSANAVWTKQLIVIHPGAITKKELRPTWTEEFGQKGQNNNGTDAIEGYIADELGFEIRGASTMGLMTNITTAVAS